MRIVKLLGLVAHATGIALLLMGCASSVASPTPVALNATATIQPSPSPSDTPSPIPPTATVEPSLAPTRLPPIGKAIDMELPEGDVTRGRALSGQYDCVGCHSGGIGPGFGSSGDRDAIAERAETRIAQEDYTGKAVTGEQYLIESITSPAIFEVEGYGVVDMTSGLDETLSVQDVADLIAWLRTID